MQICGNGFAAPGIHYQGKSNSYFQPPCALLDPMFRPVSKTLEFQLSAENLLNTNN
ncbi:MAG: hypothetical protein NVS2B17_02620 [Candidatus Velthaea sp.]